MDSKKRETREDRWRYEAITIVRYFAQNPNATMLDAQREFRRSKETIRDRIRFLKDLIVLGAFKDNPSFEKEIRATFEKAQKNRNAHKGHPSIYVTDKEIIKRRLQKELIKR